MRFILLLLALTLVGCGTKCKGTYTERDSQGKLKKFDEHEVQGMGCVKDSVALSQWDTSSEARIKAGISCKPQTTARTLVAANNFYAYRDGKIYLDLNASTGEYRRLTLAEGKDGKQVYTKLQGCYYERSGQILLDTVNAASSQNFDPMEIFTFASTSPTTMEMVRFDDSSDWDYRNCVTLDTPFGYCDLLRNGNDMYFPTLSASQKTDLLTEALLIRKQFNYSNSSLSSFNAMWNDPGRTEETREDYKYATAAIVDTPRYIDQAWAQFLRGERPTMPDTSSSRIPHVCYPAKRQVTLADGTTSRIEGEVCYVDGQYVFTQ